MSSSTQGKDIEALFSASLAIDGALIGLDVAREELKLAHVARKTEHSRLWLRDLADYRARLVRFGRRLSRTARQRAKARP